ncbi:unnamed protein product (macronuclear) [Paramecium tetraurelia]|uniref:Uncharacterized protein n=1 Tax=Paramecium tetraurelia TaxID=5888 RepID=A0EHT9_PARTE|nr:uncharacterized protein GSPATT00027207001 [Paramecium tetraurelia]CAK94880.1 unnamed protein product [Paramecium tetraurelia]|eukprot:XP_001462253.1 hypothetical protein (macronuclear) [Paramecium tetraurelia strain d4-2]
MQTLSESKKRIHEQSYAQKVAYPITPDKSHIKLNESLFNAKIVAKKSCSLIKDVQKDVQLTIKKYDEFLKLVNTPNKVPDSITSSPSIMKLHQIEETTEQKDDDQALLSQYQRYASSQELRRQSVPLERSELRLSSFKVKEELFPVEDISPIKQQNNSYFVFRRNSSQILTSPPQKKSQQSILSDYQGSYAKIHLRKSPTAPRIEIEIKQQEKPQSPPDIAKRNQEWKQRLQDKINFEQKRKSEKEMKDCTFKPKLNETKMSEKSKKNIVQKNKKNQNKSQTPEVKEIMHIIADLNQFSKQLKKRL